MKLPFIPTAALGLLLAACGSFAPFFPNQDAGKTDGGVLPTPDGGARVDGGLLASEACAVLNTRRCGYLARCGLIDDTAQARQDCVRGFEATWCGPMTWPSHVAAGALRYEPGRAEACADSFLTQVCAEWTTLSDSCTRFLVPRAALGENCYDGFVECTDGVCGGSSCPHTCQPRLLVGDACKLDAECRSPLYCKISPFSNAGQCAAYGTNGSPCDGDPQCLEGLQCVSQQCRVLPSPGASCVEGQCSDQGFCEGTRDAGLCVARKQEGASCFDGQCQSTLVCDPVRAVCIRRALSSGDPCSLAQECPPGEVCLGASAQTLGLCRLPRAEAETCTSHGDCQAHLACQAADGGRLCQRRADAGAACDSAPSCQSGAVCLASTCTPLPLPGESCAQTRACRWGLCRELFSVDGGAVCGALLSAAVACTRSEECLSGSCVAGICEARCVP